MGCLYCCQYYYCTLTKQNVAIPWDPWQLTGEKGSRGAQASLRGSSLATPCNPWLLPKTATFSLNFTGSLWPGLIFKVPNLVFKSLHDLTPSCRCQLLHSYILPDLCVCTFLARSTTLNLMAPTLKAVSLPAKVFSSQMSFPKPPSLPLISFKTNH